MAFNEAIHDQIVADSNQNSLEKYKFVIDDFNRVSQRVAVKDNFKFRNFDGTYIGLDGIDGWEIRELTEDGANISMTYANQINNLLVLTYSDAWTNRAMLTYGG